MENTQISYSYAYGRLNAGVITFADHFKIMAQLKGIKVSDEAHAYMKEMLVTMSEETVVESAEYFKKCS